MDTEVACMIDVFNVVDYFLSKVEEGTDRVITHLKLQKLVYYAQAYYLAFNDKPLFMEKIEAWDHGPVCPAVYSKYRNYSYHNIPKANSPVKLDQDVQKFLDAVWQVYGEYDGPTLEKLTHQEDPWKNTMQLALKSNKKSMEISNNSLKIYFSKVLSRNQ